MAEEIKGVEPKIEPAPAQQEVDYEAILKAKDAELAQVRTEKDNYKKGLLKAKGKLPEDEHLDDGQLEDMDERFRRIAREELLSTKEAQIQAEKDAALVAVLKRNRELELAFKNRNQIGAGTAQGTNQDKPEHKVETFFSQDQLTALKAKGWDDKKIEAARKNMIKGVQLPNPI